MPELRRAAESNIEKGEDIWYCSQTIDSGETGEEVTLPEQAGKVNTWLVYLVVGGDSGDSAKLEITIDEAKAEWDEWDAGEVAINTSDTLHGVKAVRAVSAAGETKLYVRAY